MAFIDPRRSTIDIVQALGRAIRKAPDKKLGTIVLPVFLSEKADPERVLDESAFKDIWNVVKALRAHDEVLGEEIDDIRRGIGEGSPLRLPRKFELDVPVERVGARFVEAFNVRLVEQTSASWEFYFGLLRRFVEREGHSRVSTDYRSDDGYRLGMWAANQRARQERGVLPETRARRLEALPDWTWDLDEAKWEEGYTRLLKFVQREGHGRVPAGYRDDDGYELGSWLGTQRQARAGRGGRNLSGERVRRLEALPGWSWDALDAKWEEGYVRLLRFAERERHSRVPAGYRDGDGYRLGSWVKSQRRRRSKLSPERKRRLEDVPGWEWDSREAAWESGYQCLLRFAEREGDCRVPTGYRDDSGFRLDTWIAVQRRSWVQDVPLAVLGLAPAEFARVERPPRHRQHAPDLGREFQGADERLSDLAGRTRDSDREPGSRRATRG